MRRQFFPLLLMPLLLLPSTINPASAQRIQSIFASRAQDGAAPMLTVHPGYGLNLSFITTGEKIRKAWLDDPSQIALDFDSKPPNATLIHLRNIVALNFPSLRRSPDRTTLLTIITDNSKLYQFKLKASEGMPKYTTLAVMSDQRGTPKIEISAYRSGSLEDVERGLQVARNRKLLDTRTTLVSRVQNFTALVRNGESLTTAASKAGVTMGLISKLADMGQSSTSTGAPPGFSAPLPTIPNAVRPAIAPKVIKPNAIAPKSTKTAPLSQR
jgi:hypothetical protein